MPAAEFLCTLARRTADFNASLALAKRLPTPTFLLASLAGMGPCAMGVAVACRDRGAIITIAEVNALPSLELNSLTFQQAANAGMTQVPPPRPALLSLCACFEIVKVALEPCCLGALN